MGFTNTFWGGLLIFLLFVLLGSGILWIVLIYAQRNHAEKKLQLSRISLFFMLTFVCVGFYRALGLHMVLPLFFLLLVKSLALIFAVCTLSFIVNELIKHWILLWKEHHRLQKKVTSLVFARNIIHGLLFVVAGILILKTWYVHVSSPLHRIVAFVTMNLFAKTLFIFIMYVIIAKTILYLCKTYIQETIAKHEEGLDDVILENVEYPVFWILVIHGLKRALLTYGFTDYFVIPILTSVTLIIGMHTVVKLTDHIIEYWKVKWMKRTKSNFTDEMVIIGHNVTKVVVIILGILFVLNVWGVQIKTLLLSLGVLGVVLGLALKDGLDNLIGGISLMLDQSINTGDVIKIVEGGQCGEIIEIGLRSTKIKTFDNEMLVIPNAKIANAEFLNYARPNTTLRLNIPVKVAYGTDIAKVKRILIRCVKGVDPAIDPKRIDVQFTNMGDYALEFLLLFYINDYSKKFQIKNLVLTKLYNELKKNKIQIPYPTETVYMKGKKEK